MLQGKRGPATAFIDESRRGSLVLCVAVFIDRHVQPFVRSSLRRCVLPRQRRLHFAKESDSRRRQILSSLANLPIAVCSRRRRVGMDVNDERARMKCLLSIVSSMNAVATVVIESRGESLDRMDRRSMQSIMRARQVTYSHARPHEEPLLWLPDAIAWSLGKGPEWRRLLPAAWKEDSRDLTPP